MPNNYVLLEKIVVGSAGASSVTFANIPQTGYTDLVVKVSARGDTVAEYVNNKVSFNGSTSGYSSKLLYGLGTGSGASANNSVTNAIDYSSYGTGSTATASTFGNTEIYIPNYAGSTNKSVSVDAVTENNATTAITALTAGLWSNTAAITSVSITTASGSFVANSTFYLYGVATLGTTPAIAPKATGGDIVMTDGTYWYHAFRSSGTFTPAVALSCDALVIAGGGGGSQQFGGGGGGGGGYRATTLSLATSGYTVTVGAGGAGGTGGGGQNGTKGSDSLISGSGITTFTSTGGGFGGSNIGGDGGSGGGGGGRTDFTPPNGNGGISSPVTSPVQGYAGGKASNSGPGTNGGGGGGGAGGAGPDSGSGTGANGGAGSNAHSSWATATSTGVSGYYAGGGAGYGYNNSAPNTGGSGGGGAGAVSGTANTGGGGGGSYSQSTAAGAGGSGIVIVRYLVA
jgi:hypothetical protein